jgi:hypothetical protein
MLPAGAPTSMVIVSIVPNDNPVYGPGKTLFTIMVNKMGG